MSERKPYAINMAPMFDTLERIDLDRVVEGNEEPWYNQTLCRVNDSLVRLGVAQGEFHWHKHDEQDEFFYVVEGRVIIELEGGSVELHPRQGVVVPKGAMHRPVAPERTIMLTIERSDIKPTGD